MDSARSSSSSDPEIGIEALRPEALAALREVQDAPPAERENFGLSQFWYTDACASAIGAAVRDAVPGRVAVLSCPSVHRTVGGVLFEYDPKLAEVFFDYREVLDSEFENLFDAVVLDPPYVSRDCLERYHAHAVFLSGGSKVLAFTSVVNREFVLSEFGWRLTRFELEFESKLATPLGVFTNVPDLAARLGGFV
ncbi:hypothetical protein CTAYLR_003460 [Chrysophaeum taylorii]|uniref:Uncharacterized protein n=1 Tax=Chrysophaeum taylorii TaxID=2483200 RepID=A0AAD7XJ61_9STRA|nr:hypothetical protein CTAYLR_003460 [Chrysophaeum taylorii]